MGLELDLLSEKSEAGELVSDIFIKHGELKAIEINEEQVPSLIDEIPMLAVIATQAVGKTIIRGARELRVKESDRIESIIFNLKNMGALIEEFEDGFSITGPTKLNGVIIKTFGDHRIAMAFMIASLIASGTTKLDNYECVNISFPEFFDKLKSVTS
jgi:3-phosphoshikimate 1-carboxyvinyltransferase